MVNWSQLALRQITLVIAIGVVAFIAIVAVTITAQEDPSAEWVGRAVLTALLLCFAIVGLVAAPEDTLSTWARLSRGLVLWASQSSILTVVTALSLA